MTTPPGGFEPVSDLARLREAVPETVRGAARGAFGRRCRPGEELAPLVFDSLDEPAELAGVRGGSGRVVTFTTDSQSEVVELEIKGPGRSVVGQIAPPAVTTIELRRLDESVVIETDAWGRFHIDSLPAGPLSIRCRSRGTTFVSDWFQV